MNSRLRSATTDDLPRIASTLGSAFADAGWTRWTVAGDDHVRRVTELQRLYVEHLALPHGRVWVDDDVTAVAAFVPPTVGELPEAVGLRVVELQGVDGIARAAAADAALAAQPSPLPADALAACDDAWVLATVGVHPDRQGQGLGSAVIDAGLAELDEAGASCTLRTSDERTVRLYERHGFTVTGHVELAAPGPQVWAMLRAA